MADEMSMQRHKYVELIKRELDELKIKRISDAELTIIIVRYTP